MSNKRVIRSQQHKEAQMWPEVSVECSKCHIQRQLAIESSREKEGEAEREKREKGGRLREGESRKEKEREGVWLREKERKGVEVERIG